MKYLKKFNESLDDDFDNLVKGKNDKNHDKANKFINCLTDPKLKSEFKYRLTDGEDILDLIGEFVDKAKLSDQEQFEFRVLVMGKKIEDSKTKYDSDILDMGLDMLHHIEKDDKYFLDLVKSGDEKVNIIDILNTLINYLKDNNYILNWTYERPDWNPNNNKINKVKEFIAKIKD